MFKVLFLACLVATSAHAAPPNAGKIAWQELPPKAEIVKMSPGNYYRLLITDEYQHVEALVVAMRQSIANGDPEDAAVSYDVLNGKLGEARSRLIGFPAYKDKDGKLRDAVIEAYVTFGTLVERERDEAAPLAAKLSKSDTDMRAWEKVRVDLDKQWRVSNKAVRDVVDGFAEEHRLVFVEPDAKKGDITAFDADLPITSELTDALWVTAAVRYHNALFELAGTMVSGMNSAADKMNTRELEGARTAALDPIKPALAEAKTFGAFGGSTAFRDAVVDYGEFMVKQLEGPLKTHADLTKGGTVTQEQADQLDQISTAMNEGAAKKASTLQTSRNQFMATWHFDAYLKWQKEAKEAKGG